MQENYADKSVISINLNDRMIDLNLYPWFLKGLIQECAYYSGWWINWPHKRICKQEASSLKALLSHFIKKWKNYTPFF